MAVAMLLAGCEGGPPRADYLKAPAEAGPMDFGSLIRVEPGEEFQVTLLANGAFPDEPWQAVDYDDGMIRLARSEHEAARTPGDWDAREEPDTPKGGSFIPVTHFSFIGTALGDSQLVLEVRVDGQRVDMYEVTVAVVEDPCAGFEHAYGINSPGRCHG